ncbi:MAG TPA: hypothetical protein VFY70_05220, partial [Thermomicrobiales bacterium]|nr:hypothetical protein [Thermomicrobiales bacterium]
IPAASALGIGGTLGMAALGAVAFRKRRMDSFAEEARNERAMTDDAPPPSSPLSEAPPYPPSGSEDAR